MTDGVWRLRHQGEVVADLVVTDRDFPWLYARVAPRPGFDAVRDLFAAEARLLDDIDERPEEWDAAQELVRDAVTLIDPSGTTVEEFILHIDGADAWWRWT